MISKEQLDRPAKQKNKVVVQITLPDAKTYEAHTAEIHDLAERTGALVAVKMA